MKRDELLSYITEHYGIAPDYPWKRYPDNAVFRHANSGKWFALVMDVEHRRLGLAGEGCTSIVNLKVEPALIRGLIGQPGYLPAYHMNKTHWLSVELEDVDLDHVSQLIEMSYDLTK